MLQVSSQDGVGTERPRNLLSLKTLEYTIRTKHIFDVSVNQVKKMGLDYWIHSNSLNSGIEEKNKKKLNNLK